MSALKSWLGIGRGAADADADDQPMARYGIVLPRLLRRPARLLGRLTDGDFETPRYSTSLLTAGLFALTGLYGAYLGGQFPVAVQAVTSHLGFAIDEVKVSGHQQTSEIDILERLGLDGWTSTIGFDAEAARERIAALPWVQTVAVRKIYPDALEVRIEERKPFAIWQHGSELSLIERSGKVITSYTGGRHAMLPLVIGVGAPEAAEGFIAKIKDHPELASRVKGYMRVAERRWNVRLENGVTVKFPEAGEDQAIDALATMDRDAGLLSRDIASIDMRFSGRLVVQLSAEAAVARNAAMTERLKSMKTKSKPGKKA